MRELRIARVDPARLGIFTYAKNQQLSFSANAGAAADQAYACHCSDFS
jgi:hypothetical protein